MPDVFICIIKYHNYPSPSKNVFPLLVTWNAFWEGLSGHLNFCPVFVICKSSSILLATLVFQESNWFPKGEIMHHPAFLTYNDIELNINDIEKKKDDLYFNFMVTLNLIGIIFWNTVYIQQFTCACCLIKNIIGKFHYIYILGM